MKLLNIRFLRMGGGILLAFLLIQGFWGTVWADLPVTKVWDISTGSKTIYQSVDPAKPEDWLIVGSTSTNNIIVDTDFNGTITLKDVNINYISTTQWKNAIDIQGNARVTLKLMGVNNITVETSGGNDNGNAVIRVNTTAYLTIESYNGVNADGQLIVEQAFGGNGGMGGAAIGSNVSQHNGHITINSGTVKARGGDDCAGIGGGSRGAGGWITINGGIVVGNCDSHQGTANSGAGIGAGFNTTNTNTYIRINGGDVTAISLLRPTQASSGSAIGTGNSCSGFGYIVIAGGTVRASVRSLFNDAGEPVHPDVPGQILNHNDSKSGTDGLWYTPADKTGSFAGDITPPKGYEGNAGCGIGGGAGSTAAGTIIILPSARVERVYGGVHDNTNKDIGNCSSLFYLNKTPLRVGLGSGAPQPTKNFSIRTGESVAPYHPGADMFVHVPDANSYLPAVAAKIGTTASDGILIKEAISGDTLKYYTNVSATFFTGAMPTSGAYGSVTEPNSNTNPSTQAYNPAIYNPYNVVLPITSPTGDFKLSDGWEVLPSPESEITNCNRDVITLDFGEAEYDQKGPKLTSGSDTVKAFSIKNIGPLWLDIKIDESKTNIRYFDLEGPVVSSPAVEGGAHLPVGTTGVITATLRQQVPVGTLIDTLTFTATDPYNNEYVRTVYLMIEVTQQEVTGTTGAGMTVVIPSSAAPVNTNSKLRLRARASVPSIDGVKRVWYKINTNASDPDEGNLLIFVPSGAGWTEVLATPSTDGSYGYIFQIDNVSLNEGANYIHWFVETVNTIGSRSGVLGPYNFSDTPLTPVISGVSSIGVSPVTLKLSFTGNALDPSTVLTKDMLSVTNGTIVGNLIFGADTTFQVQATGSTEDVTVSFPANQVMDAYGNRNVSSNLQILTYNPGIPRADFSTVDSAYFTPPSSISFSVPSGLGNPALLMSNGTTLIANGVNAHETFEINGSNPLPGDVSYTPAPVATFTVNGSFNSSVGVYTIHIADDAMQNELPSGIRDTVYTFRVYSLALSTSTVDFTPPRNEGYPPVTPYPVTVTNSGTLTATGLSVVLSGTNAADFTVNTGGMMTSLPGGGTTTSFTLAPRTGLLKGTYAAVATLYSNGNWVGDIGLSFTVTKLPPPHAVIDFVNETLTSLNPDSTYVFNGGAAVTPDDDGATPIPENWMTGVTDGLTNAAVDPDYGALSEEQKLTVPLRPAAPVVKVESITTPGESAGMITGVSDLMEYRAGETGEWIAIPTGKPWIDGLPPGVYYIRYKAVANTSFASHMARAFVGEYVAPVIIREVTLPATPGVTLVPREGVYYVYSGDDFRFTLWFGGSVPPAVHTDRIVDGQREVLTGTPDGTGGYEYVIPAVRDEIRVEITVRDVARETVGGASVWAFGGAIRIEASQRTTADVYTLSGILLKRIPVVPGVNAVQVAPGIYVVTLHGGDTFKVTVK